MWFGERVGRRLGYMLFVRERETGFLGRGFWFRGLVLWVVYVVEELFLGGAKRMARVVVVGIV